MPPPVSSSLGHPALPQGNLLYAVGDIHGRLDLLEQLLDLIEADAQAQADAETRVLIFLGDYVDRGPESRGVVEKLVSDLPQGFEMHFLKGNHEAILLDFLQEAWRLDHWLQNGGETTMQSYGVDTERLARLGAPAEVWRQAFAEALPGAHLRFFKNLRLSVTFSDYLFVHAGVRPGVPLKAIGAGEGELVVQTADGAFSSGDVVSWRPGEPKVVTWSTPTPLAASDREAYARRLAPGIALQRILLDLHSGRFLGRFGPPFFDLVALVLILLALSGAWMFLAPRRRRSRP